MNGWQPIETLDLSPDPEPGKLLAISLIGDGVAVEVWPSPWSQEDIDTLRRDVRYWMLLPVLPE